MPVLLRSLLRLGPINPIAVRLVHNGSRRAKHLYLRLGYLGVLIAVLLWALVINVKADEMSFRELASAGALSFQAIAYLQIALICVLAPVFMAGAIAQEADPQTWDILLTTPLGAAEIVLGNLIGRLFFILALLLASLPLFAVTQYFGGVSGETILASYAIAACAAIVVGCAAVSLSVSRVVGKRAVFTFYVAVVSFIVVTLGCDGVIGGGTSVTYFTALNPFLSVRALLDSTGYASMPPEQAVGWDRWFLAAPVKTFCALSGILSVLLIAASIVTVRIGGIAGVGGLGGRGSNADGSARAPWYRRTLGFGAAGAQTRAAKTVWMNPISWREAASRNATFGRSASRWGFTLVGVLFGASLVFLLHSGQMSPATFRTVLLFTVVGEMAVITLVAINMAATSVSREREDGTLDLLLTTPITPGQYLTGKLRGMVYYLLPMLAVPLVTLGLAAFYSLMGEVGALGDPNPLGVNYTMAVQGRGWGATGPVTPGATAVAPLVVPEAFLVATLVSLPFIALCVMVGMFMSLRSKGTLGAVVWSVGVMAVVAGFVGVCAWNAASAMPVLGSVLAALSPASTINALVYPEVAMYGTAGDAGMGAARTGLFIGAMVSAVAHLAVVYGMRSAMTRNFDMTVRKLAGMK